MKYAFGQRLGAFGMTAVLSVFGLGVLGKSCGPAPAPAPAAAVKVLAVGQDVVNQTNQNRANVGLPPLVINAQLTAAAEAHSAEQATRNTMTHTGANGSNPGQRMKNAGYRPSTWGENVAAGYPDPASVVNGWINSPGHRANILNPAFTEIGVGAVTSSSGAIYWTMDLGAP